MKTSSLLGRPHIYRKYSVHRLFDVFLLLATLALLLLYCWARRLGHVRVFCDISDLVIHLPERVPFRIVFSLIGSLLAFIALPIRDVVVARTNNNNADLCCCCCRLPNVAAVTQVLSGLGTILVGACGPEEFAPVHVLGAVLGFAGSFVTQACLNVALFREASPTPQARRLHLVRCLISLLFIIDAVLLGLGELQILPEPWGHICEWILWFLIVAWYHTFKFDLANFCLAGVDV